MKHNKCGHYFRRRMPAVFLFLFSELRDLNLTFPSLISDVIHENRVLET